MISTFLIYLKDDIIHHLSQMHPFTFDSCDTLFVSVLTMKCLLAEVEEYDPHISSVVFIYNSSCADHTGTLANKTFPALSF